MVQNNATLMDMYNAHVQDVEKAQERLLSKTKRQAAFDCLNGYTKNTTIPNSVHQLRPENINVVAALGDSLTAGNGILGTNILQCLTEYRGRSWSIGADLNFDMGVQTLPNILRKFNPYLVGGSIGSCKTDNHACSQLNVAVAGETSQDMPDQARDLVARLKNANFGVDFQRDWKMITLFIGGNDLCDYCVNSNIHSPDSYIAKIREALDILHAQVPRAFVNLAQIFDITPLAKVSQGFFCNLVTSAVCGCAKDASNNNMLSIASTEYQKRIKALVDSGRYDTRNDFTVVLQPFFQHTEPVIAHGGGYDLGYFAPDCFHFSELGQNAAAKSLWNNLLEPVGNKKSAWDLAAPVHCPHSYGHADNVLRTAKN